MVGWQAIRARPPVASRGVDRARDSVVEHATGRQRREGAELRAQGMRSSTWTRLQWWTYPGPQSPATARPAHERRPAPRCGADDRKDAVLCPDQPSSPAAVRPRSQRRGDGAQRVEVPARNLGGHDENDRPARQAHVAAHQELNHLRPMRPGHGHHAGSKPVSMQHQSGAQRPARSPATWAARRPGQLHPRRAPVQPLLDVYAGSDNSNLALSFQVVRSTTGATRLATRGPPSPFPSAGTTPMTRPLHTRS